MIPFLLRRALGAIPVFILVVTAVFFLIHLAPGSPVDLYLSPDFPREVRELMMKNYGLDQPIPVQYGRWLLSVAEGDLGYSLRQHRPVAEIIHESFLNTIALTSTALALQFLIGILIGILSAVFKYSWFDHGATLGSLVVFSTPTFLLALLSIYWFSVELGWFPTSGMMRIGGPEPTSTIAFLAERIHHLALPALVLGIGGATTIVRYMRSSMLESIRQEFARTARAKGATESRVILGHVLRNALLPVITLLGLSLPFLFSGAAVTEIVFAWPGLGRLFLDSALQRDYPVIMGLSLVMAALVMVGNLVADALLSIADPRIRFDE